MILENHPGVKLPNTLLEYTNGRLACASLTPDYHEALQNPIIHKIDNEDSTKFKLNTKKVKARNLPHKKIKFRFEEQLELTRTALLLTNWNIEIKLLINIVQLLYGMFFIFLLLCCKTEIYK